MTDHPSPKGERQPLSPDNLREAVARIIDPTAFEPTTGHVPIQLQKDALAKADAILSLPALSVPEGWVAVPREPTESVALETALRVAEDYCRPSELPDIMHRADFTRAIIKAFLSAIPSPGGEGNV